MVITYIKQSVENFDKWKKNFDENEAMRQKAGGRVLSVSRDVNDSNTVVVVTEWATADQAKQFVQSPALREAMAKGGVKGAPESFIAETV